ncbi:uncharacterized protein BKA55DRAFT_192519 [Fusarium redolens]|uniref:Uncharacterized protein n=1 Tax=Fusarium redolens TaxID=48865 RepID=A0A9P9G311_FUSRE|nr:uncharacterized protein BKA55DRAFT_192519 [Fusarium redolens]KAH7231601.1 hypothetical protein BKA55DRAFT_192519 [Fusarium redolens]
MDCYSHSIASASQFTQRPTTLQAYFESMYQYTEIQMTTLPGFIYDRTAANPDFSPKEGRNE